MVCNLVSISVSIPKISILIMSTFKLSMCQCKLLKCLYNKMTMCTIRIEINKLTLLYNPMSNYIYFVM